MRTDHMTYVEEALLKAMVSAARRNLIGARNDLYDAVGLIRAVRDRNEVGTTERNNLEALLIVIERLLEEVNSFVASTDHLEGS